MTEDRSGEIVTFYSYKGGTGRTMALANVAWILAANGKRVLVADWDLESPGLHRFFHPFMDVRRLSRNGGIIDLIREFENASIRSGGRPPGWRAQAANVTQYAFSLDWTFPGEGTLDFLPAGRQNREYTEQLNGLDWDNFYDRLGGGPFFDAMRADLKRRYDYVLIDSRTGLSDVADICTAHLPDTLVDCFTFAEQGIEGAAAVARDLASDHPVRILPVPMRVDPAEQEKAEAGRVVARQHFAGLPAGMDDEQRRRYWSDVEVPYRAYYAYEELLATFRERPGTRANLLDSYERLTGYITRDEVTALPPMDDAVRAYHAARFTRVAQTVTAGVTLHYAPEDQVWAEWITAVCRAAGLRVIDPAADPLAVPEPSDPQLTVISHANATAKSRETRNEREPDGGPRLAAYVADVIPLSTYPATRTTSLNVALADEAVQRLLTLLGCATTSLAATVTPPRFPGHEPVASNQPPRNPRFTGREDQLRELRARLRSEGRAVVLPGGDLSDVAPPGTPVALQGHSGIGKTQLAIEYANRFKNAYDIVWWIDADPVAFVDTAIADLAEKLGLSTRPHGRDATPVDPRPIVRETVAMVLNALKTGEPYRRWLVIFDNAEDVKAFEKLLPTAPGAGTGHVIITSRNPMWVERAAQLPLDMFDRKESIDHLRLRLPTIRDSEANQVAEALGDLPIAIAAAGAWLAETGRGVRAYLDEVGRQGVDIWDPSLDRLAERSPAAYRLLELCSVLARDISLDIVYSDTVADQLADLDPSLGDRDMRAQLIQEINRLALLKLHSNLVEGAPGSGKITLHRLLQSAVRSRMSAAHLEEVKHQAHLVLAATRPRLEVDDPASWSGFRDLWPHLETSDAIGCTDEPVCQLIVDRLRYMWLRGDLPGGVEFARQVDERWTAALAGDLSEKDRFALRRQRLNVRFNLGNILREQSDFERSLAHNREVYAEQITLLGAGHPNTLKTAGAVAADLRALGRYREVIAQDLETYAAWKDRFGDENPRTFAAANNLAVGYRLMGDFRSALDLDERIYERRRRVQGELHIYTLESGSNLGRDLRDAGEYDKSIALLRTVSSGFDEVLGTAARRSLTTRTNLAVSLRAAGHAAEAGHILREAYDRLRSTAGPDGPDTQAAHLSLALNLLATEQLDEAEKELSAAYAAYDKQLGPRHPHTLICVNNRAALARARGDLSTARDLADAAATALDAILGTGHPYTLAARGNLAICTAELGDLETAHMVAEVVSAESQALGPDHPDALRAAGNLARIANDLHRRENRADEERIATALERRVGPDHPAVRAFRGGKLMHRVVDPHPF